MKILLLLITTLAFQAQAISRCLLALGHLSKSLYNRFGVVNLMAPGGLPYYVIDGIVLNEQDEDSLIEPN